MPNDKPVTTKLVREVMKEFEFFWFFPKEEWQLGGQYIAKTNPDWLDCPAIGVEKPTVKP